MSEAIIVALITGSLSLAGVVISNFAAARKNASVLQTQQAVTDTKIEDLTREVRAHNHFAQRMPVVDEHTDQGYYPTPHQHANKTKDAGNHQ